MRFTYRCVDAEGTARKGLIESSSVESAREELQGRGWKIDSLQPVTQAPAFASLGAQTPAPGTARARGEAPGPARPRARAPSHLPPGPSTRGLDSRSLSLLTLHLATLSSAGIPFERALQSLTDGSSPGVARVCALLRERLLKGYALSQSMAASPDVFSPVYVNLIRIGEETGAVPRVLHRLAEDLQRAEERRRRLISSLTYPLFIVLVSAAMVAFIFYYMLPRFLAILPDLGGTVPWLTRALMVVADPDLVLVLLTLAACASLWWYSASRTPAGRLAIQRLIYGIPVLGRHLLEALIAQQARSLALMLSAGLPINTALPLLVSPTCGYYLLDEALLEVKADFSADGDLAGAFARHPLLPSLLAQMITAGEATGTLDAFLDRYADFCEMKIDLAVESLLQLLEPLTIGILGAVVGVIVVGVFLPVYQLVLVG